MISKNIHSLGADVELFLQNRQTQEIVSAVGLIGGTKESPRYVEKGNLQEDNVLAEFAIDPAENEKEFHENITSVLYSLDNATPGYSLIPKSAHSLNGNQLTDPASQEFGCDPDINAWSLETRTPPSPEEVGNTRSAGGHIHIGLPLRKGDLVAKAQIVKCLDLFIGVPLWRADPNANERDKVYGGFGSFRNKNYGLEYRTPSNIWVKDHQKIQWMINNASMAVEAMFNLNEAPKKFGLKPELLLFIKSLILNVYSKTPHVDNRTSRIIGLKHCTNPYMFNIEAHEFVLEELGIPSFPANKDGFPSKRKGA